MLIERKMCFAKLEQSAGFAAAEFVMLWLSLRHLPVGQSILILAASPLVVVG